MYQLKQMKERLMACVEGQIGDIYHADSKELGEAIDMIKDLSEAIYYCSIVEAMEKTEKEKGKEERHIYHYEQMPVMYNSDRGNGRMYYPMEYAQDGNGGSSYSSGTRNYSERPVQLRDYREGRSGEYRKMYMESKEMHKDKAVKMQELEKYMHELSNDMTEMITEASPEEKQIMKNKLTTLAGKIV